MQVGTVWLATQVSTPGYARLHAATAAEGLTPEAMQERVLSFEAALAEVLQHAFALAPVRGQEFLSLPDALGRVLAAEVCADRDQPPFPRSTRDGYALSSADPAWDGGGYRVVGSVRAGERWIGKPLAQGQATEIMTGAPVPDGADAVLMLEHAREEGNRLLPEHGKRPQAGQNIVSQGAEALTGAMLLPRGHVIGPPEIAVGASVGKSHLDVFAKPRIAIVATGDELVELHAQPEPWQIRNSNSYALAALIAAEGGTPQRLPIARDTLDDLRERVATGRAADLLLLSGGVSMGKYDLVEQVLAEAGAEFFFTGALVQPGKPVVFGRLPKGREQGTGNREQRKDREQGKAQWTYFFGLPGNPVSTQVCFHLFVSPVLRALAGRTDLPPQFVEARLADDVKGGARVTRFLPAYLRGRWDGATVRLVGWQGSGDVAANARANCYAVLPAGVEEFHAGATVRVLLR